MNFLLGNATALGHLTIMTLRDRPLSKDSVEYLKDNIGSYIKDHFPIIVFNVLPDSYGATSKLLYLSHYAHLQSKPLLLYNILRRKC